MSGYLTPDGATRQDIAEALTADDPAAEVSANLDALERLEEWVEDEKRKWRHAEELAELLDPDRPEKVLTSGVRREAFEPPPAPVIPSVNGGEPAEDEDEDEEPERPTRRQAITRILEEKPERSKKLADIVAEIERRGWAGQSAYEHGMVLRTLTTMMDSGTVKRPRKGYYKLVAARKPQPEPASTEAGDD